MKRRQIIKSAGAIGSGIFLSRYLKSNRVLAQGARPPIVIFCNTSLGFHYKSYPELTAEGTIESGFSHPSFLSPLLSEAGHIHATTGLHNYCNGSHHGSAAATLTCVPGTEAGYADGSLSVRGNDHGGQSIDHLIAQHFQQVDPSPFPSLHVGIQHVNDRYPRSGPGRSPVIRTMSASGKGQPNELDIHPDVLFRKLFGEPSTAAGAVPGPSADTSPIKQQKVFDFIKDDITRAIQATPSDQREKLEQYLASIEQQEERTQRIIRSRSILTGDCRAPSADHLPGPVEPGNSYEHMDAQIQNMLLALQCGLTRVIFWEVENGTWPGLVTVSHHGLTHGEGEGREGLIRVDTHHATSISKLVKGLKVIPEGDGSMWDRTIIVWTSSGGCEDHEGIYDIPTFTFGGHPKVPQTQLLRYGSLKGRRGNPLRSDNIAETKSDQRFIGDFFATVAHWVGADASGFGYAPDRNGLLEELL